MSNEAENIELLKKELANTTDAIIDIYNKFAVTIDAFRFIAEILENHGIFNEKELTEFLLICANFIEEKSQREALKASISMKDTTINVVEKRPKEGEAE